MKQVDRKFRTRGTRKKSEKSKRDHTGKTEVKGGYPSTESWRPRYNLKTGVEVRVVRFTYRVFVSVSPFRYLWSER